MKQVHQDKRGDSYPIVGRPNIDLSKYLINVRGRDVIDYEKIKNEDPALCKQILADEHESNRINEIKHEKPMSELKSSKLID